MTAKSKKETPAGRWRRRKEARPAEILSAALAVFVERGFAAARLDDVARRAGISKGTLYLYFEDKEALFKAVVREAILSNVTRAEDLARGFPGPTPDLLAGVIRNFGRAIIETQAGAIPKLILSEAGNFPELARFYLDEVIARGFGLMSFILERGIARGEFRPVEIKHAVRLVVAPVLLSALWRHTFERHAGEDQRVDIGRLLDTHIDVLLRGLAADETGAGTQ